MPDPTTEYDLWPWADRLRLTNDFYGEIIVRVRGGRVTEIETRVTHHRAWQKDGASSSTGPLEKPGPDT